MCYNFDEYLQVHMTDIGNSKADTSKEMEVIDGAAKCPSSWFAFKSERVKSFRDWSEDVKQRPELLAECGFFHSFSMYITFVYWFNDNYLFPLKYCPVL